MGSHIKQRLNWALLSVFQSWPAERVNSEFAGGENLWKCDTLEELSKKSGVNLEGERNSLTNGIRPLKPRTIHTVRTHRSAEVWKLEPRSLVHDQDGTLEQPLFAVVFEFNEDLQVLGWDLKPVNPTSMQQVKQLPVSMEPSTAAVMRLRFRGTYFRLRCRSKRNGQKAFNS